MRETKLIIKTFIQQLMYRSRFFVSDKVLQQSENANSRDSLHVIMPHRRCWELTLAAVEAFLKQSRRKLAITIVVNFDEVSLELSKFSEVSVIQVRRTILGGFLDRVGVPEHGSLANAMAIQKALDYFPDFEWAIMVHNDSAPLAKNWDDAFFSYTEKAKVVGNIRDRLRVGAAHSSGTLFNQREFLSSRGDVWPRIVGGKIEIDVGDGISVALGGKGQGSLFVLPNTLQDPDLKRVATESLPQLRDFIDTGTHISFASDKVTPVFGHLGRGTPRSEGSNAYQGRPTVELWAEFVASRI